MTQCDTSSPLPLPSPSPLPLPLPLPKPSIPFGSPVPGENGDTPLSPFDVEDAAEDYDNKDFDGLTFDLEHVMPFEAE